jgi:GT2 family glycosyltransferase
MKIIRTPRTTYAIGLVLYFPEESLLKRIDQMTELGYRIYIFDNSPFGATYSKEVQSNSQISYMTAGKNVGIAYSLATICATAYAQGFSSLLFLDQDTGISAQTLEFIEQFPRSLPVEFQQQYAALVFSGHSSDGHFVKEVRLAISSGSLFNLAALKQIGWHNENYFVDCVDYELCLRARRYGFKIGIVGNTPDFDHVTEQPDQAFYFFGKKLLVRRYPISRVKDALGAYLKLIVCGLFHNSLSDTIVLSRSLGLYIFGQLLARLTQGK